MTYDPKFSQKQMYDQYGRSRKSTTSKPNPGKQFADSMKAGGGGRNMSGIGAKPPSTNTFGGGQDNNPNRDESENKSTIAKVYEKTVDLLKSFGADEPKDVIVDGKRVYQGPAFRGYDPTTRIENFGGEYGKKNYFLGMEKLGIPTYPRTDVSATLPPSTINAFGVNTDNPRLNMFGVERAAFRDPKPLELSVSPEVPEVTISTEEDYTIQAGDTLSKIAKDRNTTVDVLLKLNNIKEEDKDTIFAGDKLKVPPKKLTATQAALRRSLGSKVDYGEGVEVAGAYPLVNALVPRLNRLTDFQANIGMFGEGDHGSTPRITKDAAEAGKPDSEKSLDIGYGHKIIRGGKEDTSGEIYGIKYKNEDGTYIPLTKEQKLTILRKDFEKNTKLARNSGWDKKLEDKGSSWDELDPRYKDALSSLAINVGGSKAGDDWTRVLDAAIAKDPVAFARELRRKSAGKYTKGMDNRVMKELYYAGIITNRSEVQSVLKKANAGSGVPR